jgi:hypothetical protein
VPTAAQRADSKAGSKAAAAAAAAANAAMMDMSDDSDEEFAAWQREQKTRLLQLAKAVPPGSAGSAAPNLNASAKRLPRGHGSIKIMGRAGTGNGAAQGAGDASKGIESDSDSDEEYVKWQKEQKARLQGGYIDRNTLIIYNNV